MTEVRGQKFEVGPVVVPKGRDYAAARMRKKGEGEKLGRWEGERKKEMIRKAG